MAVVVALRVHLEEILDEHTVLGQVIITTAGGCVAAECCLVENGGEDESIYGARSISGIYRYRVVAVVLVHEEAFKTVKRQCITGLG